MTTNFNYQSICDDLVNAGHIDRESIWFPEAGKDEFEKNYTSSFFYYTQNALLKNYPDYVIDPARFCYVNDDGLNAVAKYRSKTFSILINIGVVRELRKIFDTNIAKDQLVQGLLGAGYVIDTSPGLFLQKIALIFIMEHERAHLAQFSRLLELNKSAHFAANGNFTGYKEIDLIRKEGAGNSKEFKFSDHLLEMDADLSGVSYTGSYIMGELKKKFGEVPYEAFHELFTVALASIMVLFHYWFEDSDSMPIYYQEHTHPHPVIRKAYCWEHFLSILHSNPNQIGFEVDFQRIQENSYVIENRILELNGYKPLDPKTIKKGTINKYLYTLSDGLTIAKETFQYKYRQEQK